MRKLLLLLLVVLVGCAKRPVKDPYFSARVCPALSTRHVVRYNNQLIEICADNETQGIFPMGARFNPYQNQDGDDDDEEKPITHHHWWQVWSHVDKD